MERSKGGSGRYLKMIRIARKEYKEEGGEVRRRRRHYLYITYIINVQCKDKLRIIKKEKLQNKYICSDL